VGWIWGQTRYLGARVFDSPDLPKQQPDGRSCRGTRIWGRHDVGYIDQERSTSNVQLSTFNVMTEMAHGGLDMGTDSIFRLDIFGWCQGGGLYQRTRAPKRKPRVLTRSLLMPNTSAAPASIATPVIMTSARSGGRPGIRRRSLIGSFHRRSTH